MSNTCVALIGANGMLASQVVTSAPAQVEIHPFDLPTFDLTAEATVLSTIEALRPQLIINCAAYTDVDGCESNEALATEVNGAGPGYLAAAARTVGAKLLHISTDYVFDGTRSEAYAEDAMPHPQSAYGRSKLAGERAIIASGLAEYLIVRTSWLYGPAGNNFVETILRLANERESLGIVADQVGSPTFTGDLADAIWRLLATDANGIFHFSNMGQCSWYEFAQEIVAQARLRRLPLKVKEVRPLRTEEYPLPAPRPAYSLLSKERYLEITGVTIPEWRESLRCYFDIR